MLCWTYKPGVWIGITYIMHLSFVIQCTCKPSMFVAILNYTNKLTKKIT